MTNALTTGTPPEDSIPAELDAHLRATAIVDAINANLPEGLRLQQIPKEYVLRRVDREAVSVSIHAAFALKGGLAAYLQWANDNPRDFYAQWAKLAQSETATPVGGTTIVVNSQIPHSNLDFVSINSDGKVISTEVRSVDPMDDVPE